jgi:hypothetical protein
LLNDAKVTETAYTLLSDILKRGRSAGIHVLLSTQSLSGLRGAVTGGFGQLQKQLGYRIALKCDESDSRTVLSPTNAEASSLEAKRESIINKQSGEPGFNVRFNVPHAIWTDCAEHLQKLSTQLQQYETDTKVFNGAVLPTVPKPQVFSDYAEQFILGEQLTFEAPPFAFQWEQRKGNNLCVAGVDNGIRQGIIRSVLSSIRQSNTFNQIIYYQSDRNFPVVDLSDFNVEVKNHDWDRNVEEFTEELKTLVSDLQNKQTLLIINSLDNADELYPIRKKGYGETTASPQDFLKEFLDKGPRDGSFVLAFIDN